LIAQVIEPVARPEEIGPLSCGPELGAGRFET